jgi:hypothetical protein
MSTARTTEVETEMNDPHPDTVAMVHARMRVLETTDDLKRHPNSKLHIRARTMAFVALVSAFEEAGFVARAQTLAAAYIDVDRQLVHRQIKRAIARGWAARTTVHGKDRLTVTLDLPGPPTQTEFADVVEMETIGAPFLPPFSFRNESDIV